MMVSHVRWAILLAVGFAAGCSAQNDGGSALIEGHNTDAEEATTHVEPAPPGQTEPPLSEADNAPAPHSDTQNAGDAPPQEEEAAFSEADEVTLYTMSWDEAQQLIASKPGRVVVVDLWNTACVPCRREFPHLVELARQHGDAVACISYSLDYSGRASRPPETYREQVLEFLREQRATFDNILSTDDPDDLHARLQLAAPPAVYVYDQHGNLRKRFDNEDPDQGEFTYEQDVIPFVESLLAEN